jgi:hypothetical protein
MARFRDVRDIAKYEHVVEFAVIPASRTKVGAHIERQISAPNAIDREHVQRQEPVRDRGTLTGSCRLSFQQEDEMDATEKPKRRREATDERSPDQSDAMVSDITGRETGSAFLSDASQPIGAHPRSEVTSRHDEGSGANETIDGLTPTEEAIRRGAEDLPIGVADRDPEDLPVFDRGQAPPKV